MTARSGAGTEPPTLIWTRKHPCSLDARGETEERLMEAGPIVSLVPGQANCWYIYEIWARLSACSVTLSERTSVNLLLGSGQKRKAARVKTETISTCQSKAHFHLREIFRRQFKGLINTMQQVTGENWASTAMLTSQGQRHLHLFSPQRGASQFPTGLEELQPWLYLQWCAALPLPPSLKRLPFVY